MYRSKRFIDNFVVGVFLFILFVCFQGEVGAIDQNSDEREFYVVRLPEEIIDKKLSEYRNLYKLNSSNEEIRKSYADLLLAKLVILNENRKFYDIESLLLEAEALIPDNVLLNFIWGDFLYEQMKYNDAIAKYEQVLQKKPDHLPTIIRLAYSYLNLYKYDDAANYFEKALAYNQDDYNLLYSCGIAYFELRDYEKAVNYFEKALTLIPEGNVLGINIEKYLQKAKEQLASVEGSTKDENQRFVIYYAGNSQQDIGDITMEILENLYDQITSDLNYKPDIQIVVIFYRTDEFYKLNNAANWVGALARGEKIMIPLRQGYSDLATVKGTLAHEFTHVIVNLKTKNRCPLWLNEGLAVYNQFQASYGDATQLSGDYQRYLNKVMVGDKSFGRLSSIDLNPSQTIYSDNIPLGYLQSYLAVRLIIEKYGWHAIDSILSALAEGESVNNALEKSINKNLDEFENEFQTYVSSL